MRLRGSSARLEGWRGGGSTISSIVRLPGPVLASLNDRDKARIERHYGATTIFIGNDGNSVSNTDIALVEYSFFALNKTTNNHLWVGDSGASCHMTNNMDGMVNIRDVT